MTDADLIYNALLRAERRLEAITHEASDGIVQAAAIALLALHTLREEIGTGLSKEGR